MMDCKFREKLDRIFWWLVWLLPLMLYIVLYVTKGDASALPSFASFLTDSYVFGFIYDVLYQFFGVVHLELPSVLLQYASYLVAVEFVHVIVDVLIFIPRFCHNLLDSENFVIGGHKHGK